MKKILFIPIDNRPITYSLTEQIASVNKSLNLVMPKREFLGGLTSCADADSILDWLKNESGSDLIILSLDTICYGGLVSSRRGNETLDELKERLDILKNILKEKRANNPNLKIFATSSIMRISNNNVNEEEKEYWNKYGEKIFEYSYKTHKYGTFKTDVPKEILDDYLQTRKRNFEVNKIYLNWLSDKTLDFMIYSKDDTGKFGLNVKEALELESEINERNLNAIVKTGADEIPLGLLLRGVVEDKRLNIKVIYSYPNSINEISRYEDISVENCVKSQIKIGIKNANITDDNPDIILYVNNFEKKQGDLVFQDIINENNNRLPKFNKPYIIADINNANGADDKLTEQILNSKLSSYFLAYSGYNTSANAIGSALCMGIITYFAKMNDSFNENAFKKLTAIRFLDDWAYQSNERIKVQKLKSNFQNLSFETYENKIKEFLNFDFNTSYSLPWNRSFEIEINLS